MEKQVALIVTDDLTELNKRLSTGYRIYTTYNLQNGQTVFLMSKYVASEQPSLTQEAGDVPTRNVGYSLLGATQQLTGSATGGR